MSSSTPTKQPSSLAAVRESYDTVAAEYARRFTLAEIDPVARAMLSAFADLVRGSGPVADLGCGPGHVTAHLAGLGLPSFGIDLSPKMIELARQTHPEMRFRVGSMTTLDIPTAELGGILAFFSTHHTPPEWLPVVFAEFHRTLAPGACLMLGTHVGDNERYRPATAYGGHPVSYESYLLPADRTAELLERAGLVITARLALEPAAEGKRPSATFLARKVRDSDGRVEEWNAAVRRHLEEG
ncbi:class I SAM-dependent DNA methyltransferase [Streptomyces sp. 6N223]|uniref:class I SAM-dependent DNA methyltransferase n=1 Tax=Streptomyces sp. 6N223 TaxID=3457412 RepID=UPI003FD56832